MHIIKILLSRNQTQEPHAETQVSDCLIKHWQNVLYLVCCYSILKIHYTVSVSSKQQVEKEMWEICCYSQSDKLLDILLLNSTNMVSMRTFSKIIIYSLACSVKHGFFLATFYQNIPKYVPKAINLQRMETFIWRLTLCFLFASLRF